MESRLVVLISGWTGMDFLWKPTTERFKSVGYDVITAQMPNNGFGAIEETACRVGIMISELRDFYDKIVVVGHSMGGLVSRVMVQYLELHSIDAYISLGTPHNGTYLAYLAPWSKSACQMRPGSMLLNGLNDTEWPSSIPALSIQAGLDELMVPSSSTKVGWAVNRKIPGTNHISLAFSEKVFVEMWGWLSCEVFGDGVTLIEGSGLESKMVVLADEI